MCISVLLDKEMNKPLSEYWIGDHVILKKSGRRGTFAGIAPSGKARIKVGEKHILCSSQNIEEYFPAQPSKQVNLPNDSPSWISKNEFPEEIDLHIEHIYPDLQHDMPQMIINKQLSICKDYLDQAIALRKEKVTIIHGKGRGQLKLEVAALLADLHEVFDTDTVHDGGATAVWLRY